MSRDLQHIGSSREEIALRELGITEVSLGTKLALAVLFLLTIVSVPIAQHLLRGSDAWTIFTEMPSEQRFHEFELDLEDASVVGDWIRPRLQSLLVHVGVGNEQAYLGDGGVLYYRPGVDYVTGPPFLDPRRLRARALGGESWEEPPRPDPIPAIVDFRDQLRARGIELVLVPTTVKPQLAGGAVWENPSYAEFREALAVASVEVFDPTPVLAGLEEPFLRSDTHWRPSAMRAVAEALAAELTPRLPEREPLATTRSAMQIAGSGDVAVMLELFDGPWPPMLETVTIEPVALPDGSPWRPDASADLLVLGDSFSNIYSLEGMGWGGHAGFVEQLSDALRRPIDRITINDAGAHKTRQALRDELARGRDRLAGKQLVVWQFAIRELAVGDWGVIELPEVRVTTPSMREPAVVRGVVAQRASAPRPGSVPYRDCLIAVHVVEVEAVEGEFAESDAVVFVWGMRDNVWTDAARWPRGQAVELALVPFEDVADEVGGFNPQELDDDELMLRDPWWGTPR